MANEKLNIDDFRAEYPVFQRAKEWAEIWAGDEKTSKDAQLISYAISEVADRVEALRRTLIAIHDAEKR